MQGSDKKSFQDKHPKDAAIDENVKKEIEAHLRDGQLACAVAFDIAQRVNVVPALVGQTLDLMNKRLIKCQLGLFGYQPEKKKVKADKNHLPQLKPLIEAALVNGALPCKSAWRIAADLNMPKMAVSNAGEAMGLKIKPCQLGAF